MVDEAAMTSAGDLDAFGQASLPRRLVAEFVGALVFIGIGTGTATVLVAGPIQRLGSLATVFGGQPGASTNEKVFGTLLGNTLGDTLPVALAFGLALAVMIYAVGGVSGGHFNPAITFGLAVTRRFEWREVPLYWIAQILGGIGAAFIIAGIYGQNGASVGNTDVLFGATTVAQGIGFNQALLAEALIGFILMTGVMAVAIDDRAPKGWSGLIIGLALAAGILVTAAATGGSANFARSLGPFVASLPYKTQSIPWSDLYVYAAGPLIGATAAALVYESVTGMERLTPAPSPGAATPDGDLVETDVVIVEEIDEQDRF
ncbi:MAG: glycerol uptake facilitator protein [Actinomycetota bacterium]|jgi:glycerol uptake facilitator protein|nr:glycerol uptake facilitator protein [Actinomycetota bacterium]MEA2486532.1 glycerol uptake facilitator protein [Actinomycetota bacterium]